MKPGTCSTACRVGFYSATLSAFFAITYIVAQLAEWLGLLGSAGGPESSSTWFGLTLLLTPSFLLAPSFVVLMVSVHYVASESRKIFSHIAIAFATIYAVMVGMVYFVQLTFVMPRMIADNVGDISLLLFTPFDSFLYAVDILGYSFMSLSTLFAGFVFFSDNGDNQAVRPVRWSLIANGLLVPFLAFQMYVPALIWGGALWMFTFPTCTILMARYFRRNGDSKLATNLLSTGNAGQIA